MKTTTAKKKSFDCVAMKRAGAAYVHELIKDMTRQEELAFWRKREAEFRPNGRRGRSSP